MIAQVLLAAVGVGAFAIPLFSSGLRRNLTFARFMYNHTIFGDYPLYVPREKAIPPPGEPELAPTGTPIKVGYYVAKKRVGDETHDLREWITPDDPMVFDYASRLYRADRDSYILNCWAWVCRNYAYHIEQGDFWNFPTETLCRYEQARDNEDIAAIDCEDSTYLLASLLLAYTDGVYANIGWCGNELHAWTTVLRDGQEYLLESTYTGQKVNRLLSTNPWIPIEEATDYRPIYKFDHKEVIDLTK